MKKQITLFFALVLMLNVSQVFAQSLLIEAGAGLTRLNLSNIDPRIHVMQPGNSVGFHAGARVEIPIADLISLETGLLMQHKGFSRNLDNPDLNYYDSYTVRLLYGDIPIALKFRHGLKEKVSLFFRSGVYIGLGINGRSQRFREVRGTETLTTQELSFGSDTDDSYKNLDYGIVLGAGVEINSVVLGIGWNLGLANVRQNQATDYEARSQILQCSVGFKINPRNQ